MAVARCHLDPEAAQLGNTQTAPRLFALGTGKQLCGVKCSIRCLLQSTDCVIKRYLADHVPRHPARWKPVRSLLLTQLGQFMKWLDVTSETSRPEKAPENWQPSLLQLDVPVAVKSLLYWGGKIVRSHPLASFMSSECKAHQFDMVRSET